MSKSSQKYCQKQLGELGDEVAREITAHRDRYKDAGKWLGKFCSPKEWRKRQKAALKKAEVEYAEDPTGGRANGISDLKSRIERREKISLQMRLSDAVFYWLERYKGYQSVTAKDGRCILLSALPLLQPNNETVADILKEFGPWPWMPDDEIKGRACAGTPLWSGEYGDRLKALIRAALKQVRLQYQLEALKESPQGKADLASAKQPGSGDAEKTVTKGEPPPDLIRSCVTVERYFVSRSTLKRNVRHGKLKSYRPPDAPSNAPHLFSEKDIAATWPKREPRA